MNKIFWILNKKFSFKFLPIRINLIFIVLQAKESKNEIFYRGPFKKTNYDKNHDNLLLHMFQAILNIDYLKCLKLWEGVGPGMQNFKWYKIAELSEISKKTPDLI